MLQTKHKLTKLRNKIVSCRIHGCSSTLKLEVGLSPKNKYILNGYER